MSNALMREPSLLLIEGNPRSLYVTSLGHKFWLNRSGYIDLKIINEGGFEKSSTKIIQQLVKNGDVVLDIGANIGYYTIIFSKLVGSNGRVIAFEPTMHFKSVLERNIRANVLDENIEIIGKGLSNREESLIIDIGPSSATLHSPQGYDSILKQEEISLTTLDKFMVTQDIDRIDFIKIDVDGHEPFFFEGAWATLEKYTPIIIFEISHLHYLEAGVFAWDFYHSIISRGYNIFHEDDLKQIKSQTEFLRRCSNFNQTCNVIITKKERLDF
ncbi:MAG: hypothetical protein A6F70_07245 [Cycloclasticus sp. symbiont of Bathymodiolus heckerae]|nr:MAG: hypothetical protein A6F70_07245 [Cycloclasticus sp. symbiont of Bathymodiolus heckerae]